MPGKPVPGRAVQIVVLNEDSVHPSGEARALKLDSQVLRDIAGKVDAAGHPLAVIVIAGPGRGGKSFILTYFIRYLQALEQSVNGAAGDWMERENPDISMKERGFKFQNGVERTTEGIWMWSRPFIIPKPGDPTGKIAVLVMDTEGCFDAALSNQEQAAIVGLSLLTSSAFIYNETSRINENTLATVGKFMQYGQLASQNFQGKLFQQLMFLVRDWNMPTVFEYGAAGGQGFVHQFMSPKPRMSKEAVQYRQAIVDHFEFVNAYLMPHPGDRVLSDQFTGSVGEMKQEFRQHVENFVTNFIADVTPKRISSSVATGSSYAALFKAYVDAFNTSDMPSPTSIVKATIFIAFDSEIRRLATLFGEALRGKISKADAAVGDDKLLKWSKKLAANYMSLFEQKRHLGSAEDKALYTERLKNELERVYKNISEENQALREAFIRKIENDIAERLQDFLAEKFQSPNRYWKRPDFDAEVSPVEQQCLSNFLAACSSVPKELVESPAQAMRQRLTNLKENIWTQLAAIREDAESRVMRIIEEIFADYSTNLELHVGDEIQPEVSLKRMHQKLESIAIKSFKPRAAQEFTDPDFITECLDELKSQILSHYEIMSARNTEKINLLKENFEKEITEAVNTFNDEAAGLLSDFSRASDRELRDINQNILEVGLEILDEIVCPETRISNEYRRKLKSDLKVALDQAILSLTNCREAKIFRCKEVGNFEYQEFTKSLSQWVSTTGVVSQKTFQEYSDQLLHRTFQKCQEKMSEIIPEDYETIFSDVANRMKQFVNERAVRNNERLDEIDSFVNQQLKSIKDDYNCGMNEAGNSWSNVDDVQKSHQQCQQEILSNFRAQLQSKSAGQLYAQYESSVLKELNSLFEIINSGFQRKLVGIHKLESVIIPQFAAEFESKVKAMVEKNPFLSDQDFRAILEEAHSELNNLIFKEISNSLPPDSNEAKIMLQKAEDKRKIVEEELSDYLAETRTEAEHRASTISRNILSSARDQISEIIHSVLDGKKGVDLETEFQSLLTEIADLFESDWPFGASIRKETVRNDIQREIEDEMDEARRKVTSKLNEESKFVAASMSNTLTSFAQEYFEIVEAGKFIPWQKIKDGLQDFMEKSLAQFKEDLAGRKIPDGHHLDELREKLEEKSQSLREMNRANFEMIQVETSALIQTRSDCAKAAKSHSELVVIQKEVETGVNQLIQDLVHGDVDPEFAQSLLKQVAGFFESVLQEHEAKVMENLPDFVDDAIRSYHNFMEDIFHRNPLPVHPTALQTHHDRTVERILLKVHKKSFISQALEEQLDSNLKDAYRLWVDRNKLKGGEDTNLAIGIDLGTTTLCAAIHRLGKTDVLKDQAGRNLTPSYLYMGDDGVPVVGHEAKEQAHIFPEDTVFDAKRLIGRPFNDPHVQEDIKSWPFKVEEEAGTGKPLILIRGQQYQPEEILAQQLKHMKAVAEAELGEPGNITKAVITVPANFNDRQRDATRQAAQVAGLEVLQIINEPTAAAMAHAVHWRGASKTVLVFDFGGGTLDVSILRSGGETEKKKSPTESAEAEPEEAAGGSSLAPAKKPFEASGDDDDDSTGSTLEVLTTLGDTHLGGEDFDTKLVEFGAKKFEEDQGIKLLQPDDSTPQSELAVKRRLRRLRNECEKVKGLLTSTAAATANLDAIYGDMDLSVKVSRQEFEEMIQPLIGRAMDVVEKALKGAKLGKDHIDEVLMVGGSSRIPSVRERLRQFLGKDVLHVNQSIVLWM